MGSYDHRKKEGDEVLKICYGILKIDAPLKKQSKSTKAPSHTRHCNLFNMGGSEEVETNASHLATSYSTSTTSGLRS
jgi:hypothetical protein